MLNIILSKIKDIFVASQQSTNNTSELNVDTCNIILETLRKEFEADEDRNKHIEDKAKTFITLIGILLTTSGFLIKAIVDNNWYNWLIFFVLMAIVILIISLWKLINIFQASDFERINIDPLVKLKEMSVAPEIVSSRLVATYEKALLENRKTVDAKINYFDSGITFIKVSIGIFLVVFVIVAIENTDYYQKNAPDKKSEAVNHNLRALPFADGQVFLNNTTGRPNVEITLPHQQRIRIEYTPAMQKQKEVKK